MTDYTIRKDPQGRPTSEEYTVRCACGGTKHVFRYLDGSAGHEWCAKCKYEVWW